MAGGSAIYVSNNLVSNPRLDLNFSYSGVECCWVELIQNHNKQNILVGCIYKHPSADIEKFTTELQKILEKINNSNYQVIILGDMNIDFIKFTSHSKTEEYLDMLYGNNFQPIITKPTRITNYSSTLIDHIYTSNIPIWQIVPGILTMEISDHLPVFCIVDKVPKKSKCPKFHRDFSKFDKNKYMNEISSINWDTIFSDTTLDLNMKTKLFIDSLNK